jgi:hypothetical protein
MHRTTISDNIELGHLLQTLEYQRSRRTSNYWVFGSIRLTIILICGLLVFKCWSRIRQCPCQQKQTESKLPSKDTTSSRRGRSTPAFRNQRSALAETTKSTDQLHSNSQPPTMTAYEDANPSMASDTPEDKQVTTSSNVKFIRPGLIQLPIGD